MKVIFKPEDESYAPLYLTPNKVYDVIKVIDKIYYQIKADDGEFRTYLKSLFINVAELREKQIDELIS